MLLKRHGDRAPVIVAERVGELALSGDMKGVAICKEIAACIDQLSAVPKARHQ